MEAATQAYIDRLRLVFPRFEDFGRSAEFDQVERGYKIEIAERFRARLAESLQALPTDEVAQTELGKQIGALFSERLPCGVVQNLVGWRYSTPLINLSPAGKAQLARLVSALCYSDESMEARVDTFVPALYALLGEDVTKGMSWSAASRSLTSFLLMASDPNRLPFIKTREFNRCLAAYGRPKLRSAPLSGDEYVRIQAFVEDIANDLRAGGFHPRDYVDVQSLMYAADEQVISATSSNTNYWLLGHNWNDGTDDMSETFVSEQRWENGYKDKYLDLVRQIAIGDRVALKRAYTRKYDLPFNNHDATVSCMHVSHVGTVTENKNDGRNISVVWDDDFEPRTIYRYTYRKTIDRLDKTKSPKVVDYVFGDEDQPLDELEALYAKRDQSDDENVEEERAGEAEAEEPIVDCRNVIFYGPPGCGKTHHLINEVLPRYAEGRKTFVTFHPSMSYEEFVEGLRPETDERTKELVYRVKPGIFRDICERARQEPEQRFALVIDEINRANISKVFGELITLVERDKRSTPTHEPVSVELPYSRQRFSVPSNLDIYATMNSADRSIALLDIALRRRFRFKEVPPNPALLRRDDFEDIDLAQLLTTLNDRIELLLGRDFRIGHSYLMHVQSKDELAEVFRHDVLPLLVEYFYDDWAQIELVLTNRELGSSEFVSSTPIEPGAVFGAAWTTARRGSEPLRRYALASEFTESMFRGLYS